MKRLICSKKIIKHLILEPNQCESTTITTKKMIMVQRWLLFRWYLKKKINFVLYTFGLDSVGSMLNKKSQSASAYICVWTLQHLCQSLSSELGLLLRDHGPRVGGGGRLKDGLPVVRPRPGWKQVEGNAGRTGGFWKKDALVLIQVLNSANQIQFI